MQHVKQIYFCFCSCDLIGFKECSENKISNEMWIERLCSFGAWEKMVNQFLSPGLHPGLKNCAPLELKNRKINFPRLHTELEIRLLWSFKSN